jgi:hypothetical protein
VARIGQFRHSAQEADSTINLIVCWIPECTFRVRAILKVKHGCVKVTVIDATCIPSKRRSVSTQTFLRNTAPQIDRSTKRKDIVKAISHAYNQSISYSAAHRVGAITGMSIDEEKDQFCQTGLLVKTIRKSQPHTSSSTSTRIHLLGYQQMLLTVQRRDVPSASRLVTMLRDAVKHR